MVSPKWALKDAVQASGRRCPCAPPRHKGPPCKRHALTPTQRHVMLTLVLAANHETGQIPPEFSPSLSDLEEATGLARSTVRETLAALSDRGWLGRISPTRAAQFREHARVGYVLEAPEYGDAVPTTGTDDDAASAAQTADPVPTTGTGGVPSTGTDCADHRHDRPAICAGDGHQSLHPPSISSGGSSASARADGSPTAVATDPDPAAADIAHPRDAAYEHACPHCSQAPGRPCREYVRRQGHTGAPLGEPHAARRGLVQHDERQDEAS